MVLKVVRPLYCVPEIGFHWYLTDIEHHESRLSMSRTTMDTRVIVQRSTTGLDGMMILHVDENHRLGTNAFLHDDKHAATE